MRDYLTVGNFMRAVALAAAMTAMSSLRLALARPETFILNAAAALVAMTLVCGAATAWERKGGLAGLFPDRPVVFKGLAAAILLGVIGLVVYYAWLDKLIFETMKEKLDVVTLQLRYPRTLAGGIALMLWTASFETMFFYAATISFWARIFNNAYAAMAMAVIGRLFVMYIQITGIGLNDSLHIFMLGGAFSAIVSAVLYARSGLLSTMVFNGLLTAHLLFPRE